MWWDCWHCAVLYDFFYFFCVVSPPYLSRRNNFILFAQDVCQTFEMTSFLFWNIFQATTAVTRRTGFPKYKYKIRKNDICFYIFFFLSAVHDAFPYSSMIVRTATKTPTQRRTNGKARLSYPKPGFWSSSAPEVLAPTPSSPRDSAIPHLARSLRRSPD